MFLKKPSPYVQANMAVSILDASMNISLAQASRLLAGNYSPALL
jgi:hypothetical protein